MAAVVRALADGPLGRDALREVVRSADVPVAGQALPHVLMLASLRGLVVRGPVVDGTQAFVLLADWLGPLPEVDREAALVRLAERYLAGHGPASDRDLARWAGLPLGDVRRGLRAAAARRAGGRPAGAARAGPSRRRCLRPRLLGAFDPVLLGWTSRTDVVGSHTTLVTDNGVFRPFAMVDGRAVATWGYARGTVTLTPLEPLEAAVQQALSADAQAVEAYLYSPTAPSASSRRTSR